MNATVLITTLNRKQDLARAIRSAVNQSVRPEVVVIDDGSTDGTHELVRKQYPEVRCVRHEEAAGLIVRRNEGMRLARGDYVFVIDDDAEFSSPGIVARTLEEFDDPRIGAIAIPFINMHCNRALNQKAPKKEGIWVTSSYVGTAHAVRRDVFLKLNGYWEHFFHQGEEEEFCLRMLAAGYYVRLGNADPILHYLSPIRSRSRMGFYGRRNAVLFAWKCVPCVYLPFHLVATIFRGLWHGLRVGEWDASIKGVLIGLGEIAAGRIPRKPVSLKTYRLFRLLKRHGAKRLEELPLVL